ncbi:hypothetical protein Fmac_010632 [Flemingia macrophylla]|uniref:Uncharacterized protein n=1 Tax=Flemingia macrophylla TaxID=520843 RepID=A0ABD1MK44_9FABA
MAGVPEERDTQPYGVSVPPKRKRERVSEASMKRRKLMLDLNEPAFPDLNKAPPPDTSSDEEDHQASSVAENEDGARHREEEGEVERRRRRRRRRRGGGVGRAALAGTTSDVVDDEFRGSGETGLGFGLAPRYSCAEGSSARRRHRRRRRGRCRRFQDQEEEGDLGGIASPGAFPNTSVADLFCGSVGRSSAWPSECCCCCGGGRGRRQKEGCWGLLEHLGILKKGRASPARRGTGKGSQPPSRQSSMRRPWSTLSANIHNDGASLGACEPIGPGELD